MGAHRPGTLVARLMGAPLAKLPARGIVACHPGPRTPRCGLVAAQGPERDGGGAGRAGAFRLYARGLEVFDVLSAFDVSVFRLSPTEGRRK